VPDAELHPLVVAMNEGMGKKIDLPKGVDPISVEMLRLSTLNALSVGVGRRAGLSSDEYYLAKLPGAQSVLNSIDSRALQILFDSKYLMEPGTENAWLSSYNLGMLDSSSLRAHIEDWEEHIAHEFKAAELVHDYTSRMNRDMSVIGVIIGIVSIVALFMTHQLYLRVLGALALIWVIGGLFVNFMPRRTQRGAEVHAQTMALKRWIRDYCKGKIAIPSAASASAVSATTGTGSATTPVEGQEGAQVLGAQLGGDYPRTGEDWGRILVYAVILDQADDLIKALKKNHPELFVQGADNDWHTFYSSQLTSDVSSQIHDIFRTSSSQTLSDAWEDFQNSSSESGSGGGFSGGGGGGSMGGGGGAR